MDKITRREREAASAKMNQERTKRILQAVRKELDIIRANIEKLHLNS